MNYDFEGLWFQIYSKVLKLNATLMEDALDKSQLKEVATKARIEVVKMTHNVGSGHTGSALGLAEILTCLYFKELEIDPDNPEWPDRDRLILSKGHSCPILYALLALKGYFSLEELRTLRQIGSRLQGHPDMNKTPGVDMTTGSLGAGLSIGVGMALCSK